MNCKQGDLAIIVRSKAGNEGRLCTVLEMLGENPFYDGFPWNFRDGPCWLIEYAGTPAFDNFGQKYKRAPIPDAWLRPIRDPGEDAQDETLQWLPVPSRETEAA